MKNLFIISLFIVTIFSCSKSDDESISIKDQILTGTVEGKPFTFVAGKAFYDISFDDEEQVSINLTNVVVDCDDYVGDYILSIRARVPRQVGVFDDINIVTLDKGGDGIPFNNLNETVEITSLSETEISGNMKLRNEASSISPESIFEGSFTMSLCQ